MEENILSDGAVFSPLIVWDGTILDGHNRYEIIQKHPELTYAVSNSVGRKASSSRWRLTRRAASICSICSPVSFPT